ncbi:hypothetical protein [Citricoccus sp. GCM10030269]|uniref:hypothetical protein n=1 Tax=Citricoccus sp. GCM10030269 TaxID=3273388 RepID=UPI00360E9E88
MSQKKSQKKSPRKRPAASGQKSPTSKGSGAAPASRPDQRPAKRPTKRPALSVSQAKQDLEASGQQQGNPGILIAALLVTTAFMFFYLHIVALPEMSALSGGLPMPDHRFSYGATELAELNAAMDSRAHGQLNWVHKTAGVIFPLAVFVSASAVAAWCLPRGAGRWLSYAAAAVFAGVDIVENLLIESALNSGGDQAGLASAFTSARWVLLVAITLWVVLLLAGKVRRSANENRAHRR